MKKKKYLFFLMVITMLVLFPGRSETLAGDVISWDDGQTSVAPVEIKDGVIHLVGEPIEDQDMLLDLFQPTHAVIKPPLPDTNDIDENIHEDFEQPDDGEPVLRCYHLDCDKDMDGFIDAKCTPVLTDCSGSQGCLSCPDGYKLATHKESPRCGGADPANNYRLHRSYSTPPWLDYKHIRPNQSEIPFDAIDSDCDGYVDETEFVYKEFGNGVRDNGFSVELVVNDLMNIYHATGILGIVFDLGNVNITDTKHIQKSLYNDNIEIRVLEPDGTISEKVTEIFYAPYPFYRQVEIRKQLNNINLQLYSNKMSAENVYAVGIAFLARDPDNGRGLNIINCADNTTGVPQPAYHPNGGCSNRDRIYTDVYFSATGYSTDESRLRAYIINQGLYERNLTERGLVGGQGSILMPYNPPEDIVLPDGNYPANTSPTIVHMLNGTRYSADYDEAWCSEFALTLYDWSSYDDPNSTPTSPDFHDWNVRYNINGYPPHFKDKDVSVEEIKDYFRLKNSIHEEYVYNHLYTSAKPGDYLASSCLEAAESSNTDGVEGCHSMIFLAMYRPVPGIDDPSILGRQDTIWLLDGNGSNRKQVELKTRFADYRYLDGYWNALGMISDEKPAPSP